MAGLLLKLLIVAVLLALAAAALAYLCPECLGAPAPLTKRESRTDSSLPLPIGLWRAKIQGHYLTVEFTKEGKYREVWEDGYERHGDWQRDDVSVIIPKTYCLLEPQVSAYQSSYVITYEKTLWGGGSTFFRVKVKK